MPLANSDYSINDADIAIISLAGRFPGAKDIESFWENLKAGVESISCFSEQELLAEGVKPALLNNPHYVKSSGVLEDIDLFDANFFDFSPREAEILDPQQRLFLECAWEAIEKAGYDPQIYKGLIGIYAGVGINSYLLNNLIYHRDLLESIGEYQVILDSDKDFLPSRVAYKLNLKGPAVNIQTACSTSLVAVHFACQSLLSGECDMALAGGITLRVPHKNGYLYQEGMILSPDGHCRAFDAQAKGTVGSNGLGIVLLKRLEDAIADNDCIYAIIKGSAINNDGAVKVGYTAPSIEGQAVVITDALAVADVEADTITYLEAHGTGTELGDPIEIAALNKAFRQKTQKTHFCAIGSLKSNVGHMDTAAGVGGLIKTVLALQHKLKPPSLHFQSPNPKIDFAQSPFYVNTQLSPWESRDDIPCRAAVSSFGIGGTNAHVILEAAPSLSDSETSRPWQLLLISAKTNTALDQATTNLGAYLQKKSHLNLADVAYTLSCGRRGFDQRRFLVSENINESAVLLNTLNSPELVTNTQEIKERSVVFMFPGQGSQYVNMGLELYQTESDFREQVDLCCEILKPQLKLDLRDILYPKPAQIPAAEQQLQQTALSQPAIFVIEYALAQLWQSWGIIPQAMIGHSIGEYVAACIAGVFSLETALSLVAARGRMMQQLPPGTMLSVPLSANQIKSLLDQELSIAAINEPSRCVVSGTTAAIEKLETQLTAKGVECRRLHTSHAFHSQMMAAILDPFTRLFTQVTLNPPKIPYVSNLTGTWITTEQATDPNYYSQHLRQTVLFAQGLENFFLEPEQILLEVGPGRVLSSFAKKHPRKPVSQQVFTSIRHPQENQSDVGFLLTTLGNLWLAGVNIDWSNFYSQEERYRVPLPTYPFERQRYWISPPENKEISAERLYTISKNPDIKSWFYIPSWKRLPLSPNQLATSVNQVLLFIDECGLGTELKQQLQAQNKQTISVKVGVAFTKQKEGIYTLNPQNPEDYIALIKELQNLNFIPDKVIHLWNLTTETLNQELDTALIATAQYLGFYSLLFFVQACGKQVFLHDCEILSIANNIHEVTGSEILCPEKSTILGTVQTIPQEYPNFNCRLIDVIFSEEKQQIIKQLIAEITTKSAEKNIAYRGQHRWVQTFASFPLELPATNHKLKENGVYLITGGLSYLGFILAKHLAKTVKAKLILTGRSAVIEKANWQQWLATHDAEDSISKQIRKVQELEALGAEVMVISADVANLQQMETAIKQAEQRFGKINGVIHAAGAGAIWGQSINVIENITKTECENQFTAKVYGTLVLAKILKNKELDFCMLTSSLSAILGGLGFVAYAAVNTFMDTFVYSYNKTTNHPWISVDWDGWKSNQQVIINNQGFGEEISELEITAEEGVTAFQHILADHQCHQLIVSTVDLEPRINFWVKRGLAKNQNLQAANRKISASSNYIAPRNETEAKIANIFEFLLGVNQVSIHDSFLELGGDSLTGTQLLSKLKQTFAMNLPISTVFESPTVAQLAELIDSKQESGQDDMDKINDILNMMELLSDDEINALAE
ncbi:SDR family oxidoreductase [Anabaena sp. UHCC 0253]|uniref:Phenolphthiocerol/phthiocerol polyketide synthase subunit E n=1 Tax=Anabaena sp. XSPORK2A TaxID=1771346 RepID=A0A0U3ALE4_9NOST|nr:type I polyketide synthase [Anabaena sp. UHCC 0253]ALT22122.1 polyketide synthase [Anabaena sp. XSPORK2A]MTJ51847.1 SDR family oxidoreductase [Anabaena sp. UHCC 0253]